MKPPKALIEYYHLKNLRELKNILYKLEHHKVTLLIKDEDDNNYITQDDTTDLLNVFYTTLEDMKFRIRTRIKQLEDISNK